MTDAGGGTWGRDQEDALARDLAAADEDLAEAQRVEDRDAAFRARRSRTRVLDLVGDRVVALEAEGAGEIAEVRRQLAWHDEVRADVRGALGLAADVEQRLSSAVRLLERTDGWDDGWEDVERLLAAVDDDLARLRATTRRIGLTDRGARVPPVAWSPPSGRADVLGLAVASVDPDAETAALVDGRQRATTTLSFLRTLQQLLADRRRATEEWDELARERLEHLAVAYLDGA